jgi:hypothetical protein
MSNSGFENVLRGAHVQEDQSIAVSSFLNSKVGHKVTQVISTTTVTNDTETHSFYDGSLLLMQLKVIYTDGGRSTYLSAERIA